MEKSFLRKLTAWLCTLSLVPAAFARAPREQVEQPPPVMRVTTHLVQVNVIVQDKKGEPVPGLTRDDFKVLDGGKEQKIGVFSVESTRSLPAPSQPLPPNVFSNRWEMRGSVPTSVILLDGLNTRFEDQASAREQIIKFLEQLRPQDRVALYALGSNLRVVHDFTNDATPLLRAIRRYRSRIASELTASEPDESDVASTSDASNPEAAQFDAFMQDAAQRMADFYTINRADQTLRAIEAIAHHLSKLPGRKNLIWVSGSFPMWIGYDSLSPTAEKRNFSPEIGRTVQALNDANLAIYPVDARGLIPDSSFSAARKGSPSGDGFSKIRLTMETMQDLAERTGGLAFYNSNDIKGAIRSAIDDSRMTYVLGYYPADVQWNGKFREIKVSVKRPGLRLRYRRGYFAVPEETLDDKQRNALMVDATWSPLDATAVGIFARLEVPKDPHNNRFGIALLVDPHDVTFQPEKDRWVGSVDLLVVQRNAQGVVLKGDSKTVNMNLKRESYDTMLKQGLILTGGEDIESGTSELRVVVRDTPSGALGSVSIPLAKFLGQRNGPPPSEKPNESVSH